MIISMRQALLRRCGSKTLHGGVKLLFCLKEPVTGGRTNQRVRVVKLPSVGLHERAAHGIRGGLQADPPSTQGLQKSLKGRGSVQMPNGAQTQCYREVSQAHGTVQRWPYLGTPPLCATRNAVIHADGIMTGQR